MEVKTKRQFQGTLSLQKSIEVSRTLPSEKTIRPPATDRSIRLNALPSVALAESENADCDLIIRSRIAQGGMSVIERAEQRSLGREVAVKRTLKKSPELTHALVVEALVVGTLEHPNIVPIHMLGIDESGNPAIVMKRIDGIEW